MFFHSLISDILHGSDKKYDLDALRILFLSFHASKFDLAWNRLSLASALRGIQVFHLDGPPVISQSLPARQEKIGQLDEVRVTKDGLGRTEIELLSKTPNLLRLKQSKSPNYLGLHEAFEKVLYEIRPDAIFVRQNATEGMPESLASFEGRLIFIDEWQRIQLSRKDYVQMNLTSRKFGDLAKEFSKAIRCFPRFNGATNLGVSLACKTPSEGAGVARVNETSCSQYLEFSLMTPEHNPGDLHQGKGFPRRGENQHSKLTVRALRWPTLLAQVLSADFLTTGPKDHLDCACGQAAQMSGALSSTGLPDLNNHQALIGSRVAHGQAYEDNIGVREPSGTKSPNSVDDGIFEQTITSQALTTFIDRRVRILVGPANYGGQDVHSAKQLTSLGFDAKSLASASRFSFERELHLETLSLLELETLLGSMSHFLWTALKPVIGRREFQHSQEGLNLQYSRLSELGLTVVPYLRGSEVRDVDKHADSNVWSPFRDLDQETLKTLRKISTASRDFISSLTGPKLISTPDLWSDVPDGIWLPHLQTAGPFKAGTNGSLSKGRLVVLHATSRSWMKGTQHVDKAMNHLQALGLVHYLKMEGQSHDRVIRALECADVVIDQLALGSYGVFAVEAMARGLPVVGNITPDLRNRLAGAQGIIQADPDRLGEVVAQLAQSDENLELARIAALDYFKRFHSGKLWLTNLALALHKAD